MPASSLPWLSLRITTTAGNLLGAILTFFYFRVVDPEVTAASGAVSARDVALSVAAYVALVAVAYPLGKRWLTPLLTPPRDEAAVADPLVRRRALQVPSVFACLTLAGWVLAGIIWPSVGAGRFEPHLSCASSSASPCSRAASPPRSPSSPPSTPGVAPCPS